LAKPTSRLRTNFEFGTHHHYAQNMITKAVQIMRKNQANNANKNANKMPGNAKKMQKKIESKLQCE